MIRAFVEDNQYEQGETTDKFYVSGSSPGTGSDMWTFSKSLRDKEIISLSFPVSSKTTMLPNSSSIYYFSPQNRSWNIPQKSIDDHVGPWKNVAMRGPNTPGSWFIEDTIAFDSKGNSIASGSLDIFSEYFYSTNYAVVPQKIMSEGLKYGSLVEFRIDRQAELCQDDYPKSFQRNSSYDASSEFLFTPSNNQPFLIEKFVIEVPMCFGRSWFQDKTTECWTTSSAGDYTWEQPAGFFNSYMNDTSNPSYDKKGVYFEQGGPGITFSLLSQKNYGTSSIRDLIGKAFTTHENDIGKNIIFNQYNFQESRDQQTSAYYTPSTDIVGIDVDDVDIECIVTSPVSNSYTGSILLKSESSITNGCKILVQSNLNFVGQTQQDVENGVYEILSNEYVKDEPNIRLLGVDAFGRGMTGFSPSGGSIFGGEYTIGGGGSIDFLRRPKSPFYISNEATRRSVAQEAASLWNAGGQFYVKLQGSIFLGRKKSSPYLLLPGEKLILAVSKTRPATSRFKANIPPDSSGSPVARITGRSDVLSSSYYHNLGGSQGHDVQFNTGSINITLYGSYVRAGNSYVP